MHIALIDHHEMAGCQSLIDLSLDRFLYSHDFPLFQSGLIKK
jgi:hypothetical protein